MNLLFMAHDLRPILLIDDKSEGQFRGEVFMQELSNELQQLVDFHMDINKLIVKSDEWSVDLLFDPKKYVGVFLHHSYKDPLINESQLSDLRDKLRNLDLIIFSGGMDTNLSTKMVRRESLFGYSLKPALDSYFKIGVFPTSYLFGGNINRFYPIIDEMHQILEEEGKDRLLSHKSFEIYASICGWDLNSVQKNYKERLTEEQIADKINEWRLNSNQ
jgi:hypothetical protein